MADINTTIMTGRLTRDPVIKNNGSPMGHFTLASNDRYRDKTGAVQTKTAFVFCKVYGAWAEALANRKKGDMVIVTGKLRSETWGDEASQQQLVLVCNLIQFITIAPKPASDPSANTLGLEFESGSAAQVSASTADADGKVPF